MVLSARSHSHPPRVEPARPPSLSIIFWICPGTHTPSILPLVHEFWSFSRYTRLSYYSSILSPDFGFSFTSTSTSNLWLRDGIRKCRIHVSKRFTIGLNASLNVVYNRCRQRSIQDLSSGPPYCLSRSLSHIRFVVYGVCPFLSFDYPCLYRWTIWFFTSHYLSISNPQFIRLRTAQHERVHGVIWRGWTNLLHYHYPLA